MITLVQIILAVIFFFIINWLGKHSASAGYRPIVFSVQSDEAPAFNLFFRALSPVVYIIVVATILYSLHLDRWVHNLYLVTVYYAFFRLLCNAVEGQLRLVDWKIRLPTWLCSILISWFVYEHIIRTKQHLFPNFDNIGDELWLGMLIFIYNALNSIRPPAEGAERRLANYINSNYQGMKTKYGGIIQQKVKDQRIEALVYSIMIYENFNRPKLRRLLENIGFRLGRCKTLGIMQVTTTKLINDRESVELGTKKILDDYQATYDETKEKMTSSDESSNGEQSNEEPSPYVLIEGTTKKYNPDDDYAEQVRSIYDKITNSFYPAIIED